MSLNIELLGVGSFNAQFGQNGSTGPQGPAGAQGIQGIQGIQGVPGQGLAAGGNTGQVLKKLSATNYDTGWLTLPADYITSVSEPLAVASGNLSVNLSAYLPLAGGYITGDIQSINGSQFRTFLGANSMVIQSNQIQMGDAAGSLTIDAEGISFNTSPYKQTLPFLGLAGYATESWVASNFYPLASNPSGFLTASALTPYLTSADAALTYYPLTNPAGFITASALTGYATESWVTSGFYPITGNPSGFISDAPSDSAYYSRRNAGWEQTLGPDAPWNGTIYGRKDGFWVPTVGGIAWGEITGILSYQLDLQTALNLKLDATVAATTYYLQTNPDGFITSAALTGYATETFVTTQGYITQTTADGLYYPLSGNPSAFLTDAPSDGSTYGRNNGAWTVTGGGGLITSVTSPLAVNSGDLSVDLTGYATEGWVQSQGYLTSVPPPALTGLTSDISWDYYSNTGRFLITGGNSGDGMSFSARINFSDFVPNTPESGDFWRNDNKFQYRGTIGTVQTIASESWVTSQGYATTGQLSGYALLSGATFSGKVNTTITGTTAPINIGSQLTAPTTTVAGDVWIGANINYKSWDGITKAVANTNTTNQFTQGQAITVNSAVNALRINQQGTGPALVVEDSVSPDATPFVIDANGKVGVGIAPDATAAIKVDGNGISFNGLVFNPTATAAHTGGSDHLDLLVTINGTAYRIGLRPA